MTETWPWEVCDYSALSDDELKRHAIEKEDFDNIQIMFDEYNSENVKLLDNFSINQQKKLLNLEQIGKYIARCEIQELLNRKIT